MKGHLHYKDLDNPNSESSGLDVEREIENIHRQGEHKNDEKLSDDYDLSTVESEDSN